MANTQIAVKKENLPSKPAANGDAWHEFRREMDRVFDKMSEGFGLPSFSFPSIEHFWPHNGTAALPAVDMSGDDKAYKVTAELPGIDEKDVEVTVGDDYVTLKAEKRQEHEDKGKDRYVSERSYGLFQRTFALPDDVDRNAVDAKFAKGVLTITLPKTANAKPQAKKIEVKAA